MDDVHFFLGRFVRQYVEKHGNLFPVTGKEILHVTLVFLSVSYGFSQRAFFFGTFKQLNKLSL